MNTPYTYWKEWQEMKKRSKIRKFIKKEWLFTLVAVGMIGGLHFLKQYFPISTSTRIILGSVFFLFLVLILMLIFLFAKGSTFSDIIRNVPANMIWVLRRSIFGSDIATQIGYAAKREGFRLKIPFYHEDLGLVDLSPIPRDPKSITVNTKDNQTAIIDWRIETFIPDEKSAINFAVKVNNNREKFEDQKVIVIINQISSKETQEKLTSFKGTELKNIGDEAKERFNSEMADLGIKARAIEIKNIQMPEGIRDVAEYATVSKKRRKIAVDKAAELKTIINVTGADPSKVVIAEIIRSGLTTVVNRFSKKKESRD
ncbi:MAG: SPFH domain-containing protein [Candidatus Portnoybacteria bacterium]